jgi:hypothetical protein
MSWQAMEAVLGESRFQGRKDYSAFRVLLAIASFADESGVAGVAGDYLACPGYRAIAGRARVHRNTVGNVMPQLVESGELEVVEQGGIGGALWTVYRICLPGLSEVTMAVGVPEDAEEASAGMAQIGEGMAQNQGGLAQNQGGIAQNQGGLAQNGQDNGELAEVVRDLAEGMAQFREGMAQIWSELAQIRQGMAQNREGMAQNRGGDGTTVQRGVVPDPIRDPRDPEWDPGDPGDPGRARVLHDESPPFPADEHGLGKGELEIAPPKKARSVGRLVDRVGRRRAGAIAEVCGLDMRLDSHRRRCEEAAVQLEGYGEELILARYGPPDGADGGWNWYLHDWRGRKGEQPDPRLVVETIGKVWVGEGGVIQGREEGGLQTRPYSNNEASARQYAALRRRFLEDG